jgi:hypothetical protein|tara:strand:+ start:720 stop:1004 length:285 start_codon:yes stop_codon:yes gene_type:complete
MSAIAAASYGGPKVSPDSVLLRVACGVEKLTGLEGVIAASGHGCGRFGTLYNPRKEQLRGQKTGLAGEETRQREVINIQWRTLRMWRKDALAAA